MLWLSLTVVICSIDYLRIASINKERKRHDAAIEKLQEAQIEWAHKRQQRMNFINNQLRLEQKAETKFTELNEAMREYHEVLAKSYHHCLENLY